ncbi:uncharacterized protein [Setaria viridis]|uniref:uncharacterized protein n=1 Tax=Setaria viridis TaxID=4556 RepID=UPI0014933018|nr:uncharacterized protein LOC117835321 [Setaria viridis]
MRCSGLPRCSVPSYVLLSAKSGTVTFEVTNAAPNTTGPSSSGAPSNQTSPADRKPVDTVTLVVEVDDTGGVAFTRGNGMHLSAQYVGGYSGDLMFEKNGHIYALSSTPNFQKT